jgi:hypothetical protein
MYSAPVARHSSMPRRISSPPAAPSPASASVQPCRIEAPAYRAVFMFEGGVSTLDPAEVSNIKTAKANAESFMREVIISLKAQPSQLAEVA